MSIRSCNLSQASGCRIRRYSVYWMDAEHDVPFSDMALHNEFLGDRLGLDAERLAACTDQLFSEGW